MRTAVAARADVYVCMPCATRSIHIACKQQLHRPLNTHNVLSAALFRRGRRLGARTRSPPLALKSVARCVGRRCGVWTRGCNRYRVPIGRPARRPAARCAKQHVPARTQGDARMRPRPSLAMTLSRSFYFLLRKSWPNLHSTEKRMPWHPFEIIFVTRPRKSRPEIPSFSITILSACGDQKGA